jgi:RNA polymerase sigma factor (sigma-70 family)
MSARHLSQAVRHLRNVLAVREIAGLTEAELWARYVRQSDEAAFETLVHRHGPMVFDVCRRILGNEQDAEDAFQATFLVLVRKAASLHSPGSLANWLYGVARRTALEARNAAARRRAKEASVPPRSLDTDHSSAELRTVIDQELARLAEKYRATLVLCDLEGKTRSEAARLLGLAEGTVASRLARGRSILAKRLARRGFAGSLLTVALTEGTASACVPAKLVERTVRMAFESAAAEAAMKAMLLGRVIVLTEGVLQSMFLTKVKCALAVLLVVGITALSAGALLSRTLATEPAEGTPGIGEPRQTDPQDVQERLTDLKLQLQQMQLKVANLELAIQPRKNEHGPDVTFLAKRFQYRIPFEIGRTQTRQGGQIVIREVWGTRPRIEIGGQYLVRGKYALPAGERGRIYFYATASGPWGETASLDLQSTAVDKEEGEFALVHGMAGPGYFHLILTEAEHYSQWFADVYFGTGDNVWREKP